ncbi:MAG: methyltransferase, TrmH family [Nocardioidaceae bacterium]|nr:methyltransferase, TrmH family [Nocardioidaceae bacterium]
MSEVFATAEAVERHPDIAALAVAAAVDIRVSTDAAVASLVGSVTPQGIVAVCGFVDVPLTDAVSEGSQLVAVGAHVRDPGNAGSLLRCADAAGADAVVFSGSSVDPYNDKAVRASAGSIFHLPMVTGTVMPDVVKTLKARGFTVLAASAGGGTTLDDLLDTGRLTGPVGWVFGNEAWGLPADEARLADEVVAVPIYGRAESLNVATAAAVCLYATARAQRSRSDRPSIRA